MDPAALIAIEHDEAGHRFVAQVEGKEAYLQYRVVQDGVLEFAMTYTPPTLRGRRVASTIVRHALDYALARRLTVIPSCWFVAGYVERHPEYGALVDMAG